MAALETVSPNQKAYRIAIISICALALCQVLSFLIYVKSILHAMGFDICGIYGSQNTCQRFYSNRIFLEFYIFSAIICIVLEFLFVFILKILSKMTFIKKIPVIVLFLMVFCVVLYPDKVSKRLFGFEVGLSIAVFAFLVLRTFLKRVKYDP